MKIDLHCHTKKIKHDEDEGRNVSEEVFKKKVEESGVQIIAITNHNSFDMSQYQNFRDLVCNFCLVWPGVEFDVIGKKSEGHVLVVFNPEKADELNSLISKLLGNIEPENYKIKIDELIEETKNLDVIYIAHYMKSKSLLDEDLEYLAGNIKKASRLLKEPSSLSSVGVLNSYNHKAIIGTDVMDWSEYEKCRFGDLRFDIFNYENFLKLVDNDKTLINDLIEKDLYEEVEVYGKSNSKEFPFKIKIYSDVNIVFGDKGSGKSEILESLNHYYLEQKGETPICYCGGEKDNWYNEMIEVKSEDYNVESISKDNEEELFNNIKSFVDVQPVNLKDYKDYFMKKTNNAKRDKMNSLNIEKYHSYTLEKSEEFYLEYKETNKFIKYISNSKTKNIITADFEKLILYLEKFKNAALVSSKKEWISQTSIYLVDNFVDKMNNYVSQNTGSPAMPTETGFAKFAKNRQKLKSSVEKIIGDLDYSSIFQEKYIGDLGEKGKIHLNKEVSFINEENCSNIDYKTLNQPKGILTDIIKTLYKLKKDYALGNAAEYTLQIKDKMDEREITGLSDFMAIKRNFSNFAGPYKPSKGELAILSLQYELLSKQESKIFLIDEPDLSLGSIYIDSVMVPLFRDLGKSKKIVVIATHDANIAIRTRPSNSILKIVDNNVYKTYVGNMFIGELLNINNNADKLSWKEESIKYLEGGKNAFDERGELYE